MDVSKWLERSTAEINTVFSTGYGSFNSSGAQETSVKLKKDRSEVSNKVFSIILLVICFGIVSINAFAS